MRILCTGLSQLVNCSNQSYKPVPLPTLPLQLSMIEPHLFLSLVTSSNTPGSALKIFLFSWHNIFDLRGILCMQIVGELPGIPCHWYSAYLTVYISLICGA